MTLRLGKMEESKWKCFDDLRACAYNTGSKFGGDRQERHISEEDWPSIGIERVRYSIDEWRFILGSRYCLGLARGQALPAIM